ncbi:hypothetical protein [Staphylococcus delphini]|uniref:hypothetical protein n=1 Tax=Staphylococcus delphini TaxID=53344 RepID=UPI0021D3AF06|nr:hypothetical protein [Staphylococcus delphini]UXS21735.1 hypothetical protein MUA22_00425 [Staphylococcus delphini]UXS57679.1 hypothetical protein MUA44_00425 [Staphylococcus delphini]
MPSNISVKAFKQFYGKPTIETANQLIYDNSDKNGYTIDIHIKNQMIVSIENTGQIDRSTVSQSVKHNDTLEVSDAYACDAVNYVGGITRTLYTAFSATNDTERQSMLNDAETMVKNWDEFYSDLDERASTLGEKSVVESLKNFRNERNKILKNIKHSNENKNEQAWQKAKADYEKLKAELKNFGDQYAR